MKIQNAKILIMATDGFEQRELGLPLDYLRGMGATVEVTAPQNTREPGVIRGWHGEEKPVDWGDTVAVDVALSDVKVEDYAALIIPDGQLCVDSLRMEPLAVEIVRRFIDADKVVATTCRGPLMLVEAGAVRGLKLTSYKSIKTDMVNAGAIWVNEEVVNDNGIITSRGTDDLGAFVDKIMEQVETALHPRSPYGRLLPTLLGGKRVAKKSPLRAPKPISLPQV